MHDPEGERDHWIYMDLDTQLNLVHNQTYVITQAPDWYRTKIPILDELLLPMMQSRMILRILK